MRQRTSAFIERLARHVHPRHSGKEFCMLEAYMDESGIHDGAHACVIAGYWGGERRWRSFEPKWKKIIEDADEPTLREFHSIDFWNGKGGRKGVFARWSDTKAEKFIDDLLGCIESYNLYPTSATIKIAAWKKLTKNERRFLTGGKFHIGQRAWITRSAPNKTYYLPFQCVVAAAGLACKDGLTVHYVFDLHKQFKHHASTLFALLKEDQNLSCRHRLGEFVMADSVDAPGLQAADLLAFQTYQNNKKRMLTLAPTKASELPYILRRAISKTKDDKDHPFFDEYGLDKALSNLPLGIRQSAEEFPLKSS